MSETTDAVAQARELVLDAMPSDCREVIEIAERDVDALIAAVRAECAADTKRLNWLEAFGESGTGLYAESNASHFDWSQGSLRAAIDHAMQEAHP